MYTFVFVRMFVFNSVLIKVLISVIYQALVKSHSPQVYVDNVFFLSYRGTLVISIRHCIIIFKTFTISKSVSSYTACPR